MSKRSPQPRCKCGHARSRHSTMRNSIQEAGWFRCVYCHGDCQEFREDGLKTIEVLYNFQIAKGQ